MSVAGTGHGEDTASATVPVVVAALYRFAPLDEFERLREPLLDCALRAGIKGTLLLAHEGINGTIAGTAEGIASVLGFIRAVPALADADVKYSTARTMPFGRMKVRLKREIVTMGVEGIDPLESVGRYVAPRDWNALISDPGTLVIDTRNAYEVGIGTFVGAVEPATRSFRQFPGWMVERLARGERPQRIAMFCTGGIRCEKATALVRKLGFDEVYHLKGGILSYLEHVPPSESLWRGECYVFDERVSVGHALSQGTHRLCHRCGNPVPAGSGQGGGYADEGACGCGG
ncbi:MAG: rhodanese-related sulfurtransferase [Hyphomicrobiaceae bacterium]|nr:rhodanese-related sulfurtransferase [Hyphomicrobiaceae bacterium]